MIIVHLLKDMWVKQYVIPLLYILHEKIIYQYIICCLSKRHEFSMYLKLYSHPMSIEQSLISKEDNIKTDFIL